MLPRLVGVGADDRLQTRKQQPAPVAGASSVIIADAVTHQPTVRC
jgi:hypothetical protein